MDSDVKEQENVNESTDSDTTVFPSNKDTDSDVVVLESESDKVFKTILLDLFTDLTVNRCFQ